MSDMFDQLASRHKSQKPEAVEPKKEPKKVGKRSNKDYEQTNVYLLKTLKQSVKVKLMSMEGIDLGDLIGELLTEWLEKN